MSRAIEYDNEKASKVLSGDPCEREDLHTPGAPASYLGWHAWAEKMSETHVQSRCPGCTLFKIWEPKR